MTIIVYNSHYYFGFVTFYLAERSDKKSMAVRKCAKISVSCAKKMKPLLLAYLH